MRDGEERGGGGRKRLDQSSYQRYICLHQSVVQRGGDHHKVHRSQAVEAGGCNGHYQVLTKNDLLCIDRS